MPRSPDYNDTTDEAERPTAPGPAETITPVLEPNEARGGVTHHNVRIILAVSLVVVIVAMGIAWLIFFPAPDAVQTTLPEDAATVPAPAPPAEP